ncbi:hypothetical protein EYF80_064457 [Liparis tanakae]|uniref:Uncharacterized protein n=1 Tax=Liparis tanakae TaxID=230148 RepID=A0A4Z2EA50_9TELE|nr:hypothetical protein EYF80_064457 [Liparis tanakae]
MSLHFPFTSHINGPERNWKVITPNYLKWLSRAVRRRAFRNGSLAFFLISSAFFLISSAFFPISSAFFLVSSPSSSQTFIL